ncbi:MULTISPECIES: ABC transporter substrate-binding protein [Mesotoga]|jgi:raffinose/stachyose/melibiose transport system substrate-binding protein|uniref:ABC transporter substrate-binding protein n=3 Tax=Kosmotogaceae TaxID=1643948 RepID=UPI0002CCACA9|nr:MAG: ABC-type sugar transport system, periplasmic component [Thermotogales bacterium 46_20]CCU84859.1 Extracellular solute-binding protein family 1 [Mesotoga infera]
MKKFLLLALVAIIAVSAFAGKVTIWSWRTQDAQVWEEVEAALKSKGLDITIEYTAFAPTEYDSKVALALQTGEGPDIVYSRRLPGGRTQVLIENGLYLPIDEFTDMSNFPQAALNSVTWQDKVYGVPFAVQVVGIFYNKDYYEEFGLEEPATWDELVANAEVIKNKGITPFFLYGKEAWALTMQHAMCGVSVLGPDWIKALTEGKTNFLDPKFTDLNKRLNDLKVYYQDGFMGNTTVDQDAAFAFGQAAMVFYGAWGYQTWKDLNPDLNVGYFMVPPLTEDQTPYAYTYLDGAIALTSNVKNLEDSKEIIKFCATPEFGTIFAGITYNIPAVLGASIPPDPLLEEVLDVYNNNASPWVYWVGSVFTTQKPSLYDDVLSPGMQALYAGQLTPEGLSQMAQDAISQWYPPLMNQ